MVLPLVRWWWWCCCLFLHQWRMVRWSTKPVVAGDDEDGIQIQWRWTMNDEDSIQWRRGHLTAMAAWATDKRW